MEAVRFYVDTIKRDAHLNAWLSVYEEEALALASQLDDSRKQGEPLAPLHGVVVGLKDVILYKDHPVSAASAILQDYIAIYDATATTRLQEAGAIIIGRQNCDEFAMGTPMNILHMVL